MCDPTQSTITGGCVPRDEKTAFVGAIVWVLTITWTSVLFLFLFLFVLERVAIIIAVKHSHRRSIRTSVLMFPQNQPKAPRLPQEHV